MIKVSCICPTYSRPELVKESIASFLAQDFNEEAELIVLNDCAEQELIYEHLNVRVYNTKERFKTLGEKYNAMFEMAKGRFITPWEDDDIFLPHKLQYCYDKIKDLDYFKLPWAYYWNQKGQRYHGVIRALVSNIFYCTGMWRHSWLKEIGGCDAVCSNADQTIEEKLQDTEKKLIEDESHKQNCFYIYRWGITRHLSGYGEGEQAQAQAQKDLFYNAPRGRIYLNPVWRFDYTKMVEDFNEKMQGM